MARAWGLDSLIYLKAAQRIEEPIEMLGKLGEILYYLLRADKSIEIFSRLIDIEGETIYSLDFMMRNYDFIEDSKKTVDYCNKIIDFPSDSYEDIEIKVYTYCIMFDIYIYEGQVKKAEKTMKDLKKYLENTAGYSKEDRDNMINQMKDILRDEKMN